MDFGDLFLTPVYIILLYFIFRLFRKKYDNPTFNKYYNIAFWLKMFACIVFSLYYVYLAPGDSLNLYYKEGHAFYQQILKDPSNIKYFFKTGANYDFTLLSVPANRGYFFSEPNFVIIKLTAFLSFFTFGKFLPINLLFAALGLAGLWKLFIFFTELKPYLHRAFAFSILFFPSIIFWSAGLLKDTVCMAAIGFITLSLYRLWFLRQKVFKNFIVFLVFATLLAAIKVYILLAYLPFLVLFIVLKKIGKIKIAFIRMMMVPVFVIFCIAAFAGLLVTYQDELGHYALEEVTTSISKLNAGFNQKTGDEDAASNFSLGVPFVPSVSGLMRVAPYAIAATFFRPFIWEASKLSQMMSAVESIFLMLFTVYVLFKSRFYKFIYYVFTDPLILYCFFFSIIFAVFVGASTLNFGTLVRYKIPCLPFFVIALVLILDKIKRKEKIHRHQEVFS